MTNQTKKKTRNSDFNENGQFIATIWDNQLRDPFAIEISCKRQKRCWKCPSDPIGVYFVYSFCEEEKIVRCVQQRCSALQIINILLYENDAANWHSGHFNSFSLYQRTFIDLGFNTSVLNMLRFTFLILQYFFFVEILRSYNFFILIVDFANSHQTNPWW